MNKLIVIFCFFLSVSVIAQTEKYHRVKIDISTKGIIELAKAGLAVDHGDYKKGVYFTSDLSDSELKLVKQLGYTFEIQIQDVANFYAHQNDKLKGYNPHNTVMAGGSCNSCEQYQTPVNFNLGSMGGFFTHQEMLDILDSMAAKFPNLISVRQQIGTATTAGGNSLYYVKISDNPSVNEAEPQVLYTALHHAREPESLSQLIFYMWYLLENYNSNTEIQALVNNLELYFIPCINPDGYIHNQTTNPLGGGMWRKNRRNNGNGTFGVDLNRNYGEHWGFDNLGSSPITSQDTYRGTAGFSEVETQLVRDFCNAHQFQLALNNHTYGNLLVYPWGYIAGSQTPDSLTFRAFAKRMTKCSRFSFGTGDETVGYVVNGDSDDWMYGDQISKPMILSMTPEAGNASDGFWPAINRIVDIAKATMDQNLSMARLASAYGEAESIDDRFISSTNEYVKYNFKRLGLMNGTFTVSVIPITTNIATAGAAKTYINPIHLRDTLDSIAITLNTGLAQGDMVKYAIAVNNGLHTHYDTITRIYGQPVTAFYDACNTTMAFDPSGWGISTSQFVTASSSITDSPSGLYFNNNNSAISTSNTIDLTNAIAATLSYYSKWDIEKGYDYVEVLASTDGIIYTPLCGKYTSDGSAFQNNGLPMYDGKQVTWVKESIDLSGYLGQNIKLRFRLVSDGFSTGDGFYADEITVQKIINNIGIEQVTNFVSLLQNYPNPCSSYTNIAYTIQNKNETYKLQLIDALGKPVLEEALDANASNKFLDVTSIKNGVYYYKIISQNHTSIGKPLVIMRD